MNFIFSVLICGLVVLPNISHAEEEPFRVTHIKSQIELMLDTSLVVTEVLTIDLHEDLVFPVHFTRAIATVLQDREGNEFHYRIRLEEVKINDRDVRFQGTQDENAFWIHAVRNQGLSFWKSGLSAGQHTFKLKYTVLPHRGFLGEADELVWSVTGEDSISNAHVQVVFPRNIPTKNVTLNAYAALSSVKRQFLDVEVARGTSSIDIESNLKDGEAFIISLRWPKGYLIEPDSFPKDRSSFNVKDDNPNTEGTQDSLKEREKLLRLLNDSKRDADSIEYVISKFNHHSEEINKTAALVAVHLGKAAVPALAKALEQGQVRRPAYALAALQRIGPHAIGALPQILSELEHESFVVRAEAIRVLASIGSPAVPSGELAILELLETEKDSNVRTNAILALGDMNGDDSISTLVKFIGGKNEFERKLAVQALRRYGPEAGHASASLIPLLKSSDFSLAASTAKALGALQAKDAISELSLATTHSDIYVHTSAVGALAQIEHPQANKAVLRYQKRVLPKLAATLKTGLERQKCAIGNAIGLGKVPAVPILDALLKSLDSSSRSVQTNSIFAIGSLGANAASAVDSLKPFLNEPRVRVTTAGALAAIGTPEALQVLREYTTPELLREMESVLHDATPHGDQLEPTLKALKAIGSEESDRLYCGYVYGCEEEVF